MKQNQTLASKEKTPQSGCFTAFVAHLPGLEPGTFRLGGGHTDFFLVPHRTTKCLEAR